MKKLLVLCLLMVLLAACGSSSKDLPDDNEAVSLYKNDQTLTQNMEGVKLMLDYEVKKVTEKVVLSEATTLKAGDVLVEMTGTIDNTLDRMIYYSPLFIIQTADGVTLEEVSSTIEVTQLEVVSGKQERFTNVYVIDKAEYERIAELNLRIPAAFKEPNSESSGDALGDFTDWQIPIK